MQATYLHSHPIRCVTIQTSSFTQDQKNQIFFFNVKKMSLRRNNLTIMFFCLLVWIFNAVSPAQPSEEAWACEPMMWESRAHPTLGTSSNQSAETRSSRFTRFNFFTSHHPSPQSHKVYYLVRSPPSGWCGINVMHQGGTNVHNVELQMLNSTGIIINQ